MVFKLEVLQAKHGDCLILHCGKANQPRYILIDGGPSGVYDDPLLGRLEELRGAEDQLSLEMVMVSHIDDDHINGILRLANDMKDLRDQGIRPTHKVKRLWHNSFGDLVGQDGEAALSRPAITAAVASTNNSTFAAIDERSRPIIASVGQGRELRGLANALGWELNSGLGLLSLTIPQQSVTIGGAKLTVIGPNADRVDKLRKDWKKKLQKILGNGDPEIASLLSDRSVYNLASVVVVAEAGGKAMLLTGDARSDDICEALAQSGRLDNAGTLHVEVLKLPHHGSCRNIDKAFFDTVTADHYVISANGKHDNPDIETLKLLTASRGNTRYKIHFTNEDGEGGIKKKLAAFFKKDQAAGKRKYKVNFRDPAKPSFTIKP